MIQWLIQTNEAHPALAAGDVPAGLLTSEEQETYRALFSARRRRDWLLGRWTAKRLLQAVLGRQNTTTPPALSEILIDNNARGVPISPFPHPLTGGQLTISHTRGRAFCAVSLENFPIGADLEYIESRRDVFVADYFNSREQRLVEVVPAARRPLLATAIWSGKEAALKALQLGLSVDTRSITCLFDPAAAAPRWTPFEIVVDRRRLPETTVLLQGWWRVANGFVYTLALPNGSRSIPATGALSDYV